MQDISTNYWGKEVAREMSKYFELNKNKNTTYQKIVVCGIQQKDCLEGYLESEILRTKRSLTSVIWAST